MSDTASDVSEKILSEFSPELRKQIETIAPDLMRLANPKNRGFVIDLEGHYLSITGEEKKNVVEKKIKRRFKEGVDYNTEVVKTVSSLCSFFLPRFPPCILKAFSRRDLLIGVCSEENLNTVCR